jgi:hypothetical protein
MEEDLFLELVFMHEDFEPVRKQDSRIVEILVPLVVV